MEERCWVDTAKVVGFEVGVKKLEVDRVFSLAWPVSLNPVSFWCLFQFEFVSTPL